MRLPVASSSRSARRPALDLQAAPVIVGNPANDLLFAGREAQAIQAACYPDGRYLGHASLLGFTTSDGPRLPSEVLEFLPTASVDGASLMHLACHAVGSASAPGQSYLVLARRQKLLVESILRRANGRPADCAGRPGHPGGLRQRPDRDRDFDEALTLATAFLAAGAVTVVGTRWRIHDRPAALMMFMFHHFLTQGGLPPARCPSGGSAVDARP